jgi:hypothetical protein
MKQLKLALGSALLASTMAAYAGPTVGLDPTGAGPTPPMPICGPM